VTRRVNWSLSRFPGEQRATDDAGALAAVAGGRARHEVHDLQEDPENRRRKRS